MGPRGALCNHPVLGVSDDPLTRRGLEGCCWSWAQADAHLRAIDGRARLHELTTTSDARRKEETRRLLP